jgi:hypothetical protein
MAPGMACFSWQRRQAPLFGAGNIFAGAEEKPQSHMHARVSGRGRERRRDWMPCRSFPFLGVHFRPIFASSHALETRADPWQDASPTAAAGVFAVGG